MTTPEPFATAVFLTIAMSLAGCLHVLWLKSDMSKRWQQPLDGGRCFRGRRLFGPNKMLRGLLVLPVATAVVFCLFALMRPYLPDVIERGMWQLSPLQFAGLGLVCGLMFMLAELPNSFLKRQLDIASGSTAQQPFLRRLFMVIDRFDSAVGVLLAVTLLLPVTPATWGWTLALGVGLHAMFSYILHRVGVKNRAL